VFNTSSATILSETEEYDTLGKPRRRRLGDRSNRTAITALLLFAFLILAFQSDSIGLAQQSATTFIAPFTQSLGCQSGTCTLVIPPYTVTIPGSEGTLTNPSTTIAFSQTELTFTYPGATVTLTATTSKSTPPPTPPYDVLLYVAIAAGIAVLGVATFVSRKSKNAETITQAERKFAAPDAFLDDQVLQYVTTHGGSISVSRGAKDLGITEQQLKDSLSRLVEKGALNKET
jgi:hypothetical protein